MFAVRKITSGPHAGMYFLMDEMTNTVLQVKDNTYKSGQYLVAAEATYATTQLWKIDDPSAETTISDPTGTWCLY